MSSRTATLLTLASLGLVLFFAQQAAAATLRDSLAPPDPTTRIVGQADPASIVHLQFVLRLRDAEALNRRLVEGPALSRDDIEWAFLPTRRQRDSVVTWLVSQGLTIEETDPGRMVIATAGRVDTVAWALGVHFMQVASEGSDYIAADTPPSVPDALAGTILSINGLQPQLHARTQHVFAPRLMAPRRPFAVGLPGAVPYIPSDLLNAYRATGLSDGAGTMTAVVIDTFPMKSDLTAFWSLVHVRQHLPNVTFIQAVPGILPAPTGEETLDTEYASAMGAASKVRVYASRTLHNTSLDSTFLRLISDMLAGVPITQVSISLGECETRLSFGQLASDDAFFLIMSALGASVFVGSGDTGSHECFGSANVPSFYSTSPHVTAAGGTTLTMSGVLPKNETGWTGSGGGVSTFFPTPSWQRGLGYPMRAVPDISAAADPNSGVLLVFGGAASQVGGTSASTPILAGLIGLANAERLRAGKSPIGLLNPDLYALLKTADFRDIRHGGNGGYSAGIGYDLVTGIGSPIMKNLLPALVRQP